MNSEVTNRKMDTGAKLSLMWIVVMFNMVFADILGFIYPGSLADIMTGSPGGVEITPAFLLAMALLLEIPIAMIFLSRTLGYRANRWANTVAAVVTAAFVIVGKSDYLHYYFFAAVEVAVMGLIVWTAWKSQNAAAPVPAASLPARAGDRSSVESRAKAG